MHVEVPWQSPTWHWDGGALRRTEILRRAAALLGEGEHVGLTAEQEERLKRIESNAEDVRRFARGVEIGLGLASEQTVSSFVKQSGYYKAGKALGQKLRDHR